MITTWIFRLVIMFRYLFDFPHYPRVLHPSKTVIVLSFLSFPISSSSDVFLFHLFALLFLASWIKVYFHFLSGIFVVLTKTNTKKNWHRKIHQNHFLKNLRFVELFSLVAISSFANLGTIGSLFETRWVYCGSPSYGHLVNTYTPLFRSVSSVWNMQNLIRKASLMQLLCRYDKYDMKNMINNIKYDVLWYDALYMMKYDTHWNVHQGM